jgi:hypothetical protein
MLLKGATRPEPAAPLIASSSHRVREVCGHLEASLNLSNNGQRRCGNDNSKVHLICVKQGRNVATSESSSSSQSQIAQSLCLDGSNHLQRPSTGKNANLLKAQKQTQLKSADTTKIKGDGRMATKPTYEQAQLHLQVFEQRREPRLRQARDWFFQNYFANTMEEAMKIGPMGTEEGTNVMMVFGYWEQTCALLNYGLLHEDLFFETTGEFFGVWERVKSHIAQGRQMWSNKSFLSHLEKAAQRFEEWNETRNPGNIAAMRKMMSDMEKQRKEQAKAA